MQLQRLTATATISASGPVNQPVVIQSVYQAGQSSTVGLSACPSDSVAELCLAILPVRDLAQVQDKI